jgi:hypothetical protein
MAELPYHRWYVVASYSQDERTIGNVSATVSLAGKMTDTSILNVRKHLAADVHAELDSVVIVFFAEIEPKGVG